MLRNIFFTHINNMYISPKKCFIASRHINSVKIFL